ncbi:MAG TPA: hypothetical protein PLS20_05985, partial [Ruminococcus flavefaciens]|nr:hypothetical protein [Ruminococcus flavefaciens]
MTRFTLAFALAALVAAHPAVAAPKKPVPAAAPANPARVRFLPGLGTAGAGPERRGAAVLAAAPRP